MALRVIIQLVTLVGFVTYGNGCAGRRRSSQFDRLIGSPVPLNLYHPLPLQTLPHLPSRSVAGALESLRQANSLSDSSFSNRRHPFRILEDVLGTSVDDGIVKIDSAEFPVRRVSDLTCNFDGPCCWRNIVDDNDGIDWHVVLSRPNHHLAAKSLSTLETPVPPFAAASSSRTGSLTYGTLVSCPIQCQKGDAILTFDHWTWNSVAVDVCTLSVANSQQFTYCTTVDRQTPIRALVKIPQQDGPFVVVIVSSEFTDESGGVAVIDNIRYSAVLCNE